MGDIGVCEELQFYFVFINILDESMKFWVWFDDVFQWQSIINLGIVFKGVDLVVMNQVFKCEFVVSVVFFVKMNGIVYGEFKVFGEVFVDKFCYEILDFSVYDIVNDICYFMKFL